MRSVLTLALGLALAACQTSKSTESSAGEQKAAIPELSVPKVAELVQAKSVTVVDANNAETRNEYGVVPGAVLLSSSKDYALSELPGEKSSKLVFYCGGTKCRASDNAAERARQAGYSDVNVMREGIRGWKDAGQKTATPQT